MNHTKISYLQQPDYKKPPWQIPPEAKEQILARLCYLYDETKAKAWMTELERVLKLHQAHKPPEMIEVEQDFAPENRFTEKRCYFNHLWRSSGEQRSFSSQNFV